MADKRHVDMLKHDGVHAWNRWREEEPAVRPDLSKAQIFAKDLTGVNLQGADLQSAEFTGTLAYGPVLLEADLRGARLQKAFLWNANLSGADLSLADLTGANLSDANLSDAHLIRADLTEANLSVANFTRADLTGANLTAASCVRTNFSGATLMGCTIYGMSAWDLRLDGAKQTDLRITPDSKAAIVTVDNLEVAQFLYLVLNNPKVRAALDTITSKVVLILGRFSPERKPILDALREALRNHRNGYIPVLFDFDPQQYKPPLETVKTLANLSRFVIADLTDPNMVRSELTYITANVPTVPVKPVMLRGAHLPTEYWTWKESKGAFLDVYEYVDLPQLLANLTDAVITPVEAHVRARPLTDADGTK